MATLTKVSKAGALGWWEKCRTSLVFFHCCYYTNMPKPAASEKARRPAMTTTPDAADGRGLLL